MSKSKSYKMGCEAGRAAASDQWVCAGCWKPVRWSGEFWRAPEGWEHVELIDPASPCHHLSGDPELDIKWAVLRPLEVFA